MFRPLANILDNIVFGPHKRKVQKYLDEATTDSVLEDLTKKLAPRLRRINDFRTIFDAYCIEDSFQKRYWNEDSFRKYIETVYPDVASNDATMHILWGCFHFYAYHPFPRNLSNGRIDSDAFERAVSLLVVQDTDLLGTQDDDYFWRDDEAFFRKADFNRILRSISLRENTGKELPELADDLDSVVDDAVDVLATTQPYWVCLAPSPDQLGLAAQKLLRNTPTQLHYQITHKELSMLLSLIMRLRLHVAKWGRRFHFGVLDKANPDDEKLADTLINGLCYNKKEEALRFDQLLRAIDLLPNFRLKFYQLWAVLFQPPMVNLQPTPSRELEPILDRVLRAISLFVPQPLAHSRSCMNMRVDIERSSPLWRGSEDMTLPFLVELLAYDENPHIVLFTSDENKTTPATVMGAYFPGPFWSKVVGVGGVEKHLIKTNNSHILFYVGRELRLLRWNRPCVPLRDTIHIDDDNYDVPSLEVISARSAGPPEFNRPYRIGGPGRKGTGLRIDPETRLATLISISTGLDSGEEVWYEDMSIDGDSNEKTPAENWEVTFKLKRLDIFRVSGSIDEDLSEERTIRAENLARYVQDPQEPKVSGEELKQRIQGFGPTGS